MSSSAQYGEALRIDRAPADARSISRTFLAERGQIDEAVHQYREVVRLKPDSEAAHEMLNRLLGQQAG